MSCIIVDRDYAQTLEERSNGTLTTSYLFGDKLEEISQGNQSYTVAPDGQHSIKGLINAQGQLTDQAVYQAFGDVLSRTGSTAINHGYTGEYRESLTGLVYLRARWYEPESGRFLLTDPVAGNQRKPLSLNKYAYTLANPVNATDPSGGETLGDLLNGLNTASTLASNAVDLYNHVFDDDLSLDFGLFDVIVNQLIGGSDGLSNILEASMPGSATATSAVAGGAIALWHMIPHRHHVVPVYLCGRDTFDQAVWLNAGVHSDLHKGMDNIVSTLEWGGVLANVILARGKRKAYPNNKSIRLKYLRKRTNREIVALAIGSFYRANDWFGNPAGVKQPKKNFDEIFLGESKGYIGSPSGTSLPTCRKVFP